jgi:Domain of unknown function (DUF3806)
MPRYAIGDLMLDVDIPARFSCAYALSGTLVAKEPARGVTLEISVLTLAPKDPTMRDIGARTVVARATESGVSPRVYDRPRGAVVVARIEEDAWRAGVGNRVIVATPTTPAASRAEADAELEQILASAAPAHDEFPAGDEVGFCALRPSHAPWFEQIRAELRGMIGWSHPGLVSLDALDAFWSAFVDAPPTGADMTTRVLLACAAAFGDHLCEHGFTWCVSSDRWGTALGVVAHPGTSKMLVVPESFVGKRWEARTPRFFAEAVPAIARQASEVGVA